MFGRISEEPVVFWGLVSELASVIIGVLLIFGVLEWSGEQVGAVMLVLAAVGSFLVFFVRRQTTALVNPVDNDGNTLVPRS